MQLSELMAQRNKLLEECGLLETGRFSSKGRALFRKAAQVEEQIYRLLKHQGDEERFKHMVNALVCYRQAGDVIQMLRIHRLVMADQAPQRQKARSRFALLRALIRFKDRLQSLDLSGLIVGKINLRDANLAGASFRNCRLMRTDLRGAELSGANMEGALLTGVRLDGAQLGGSYWKGAELARCSAVECCFDRAYIIEAQFDGLKMDGSSLQSAIIQNSSLLRAGMERCDLTSASCTRSKFEGANLENAVMVNAVFSECDFQGAILINAQRRGAKFDRVRMDGAFTEESGFKNGGKGKYGSGEFKRSAFGKL
ncbi:pentapeptide repeat-containing protein [bacterium]|nr:pentapeptide repeat-containing protein [candidate division CSSED10-310 bacterium]